MRNHHGSQILGEARHSFLQEDEVSAMTTVPTVEAAQPQAEVPSAPPTNEARPPDSATVAANKWDTGSIEEVIVTRKPWEEPAQVRPQSATRRNSTVRLPGLLLTDEEDDEQNLEKELRAKELIRYLQEKWNLETTDRASLTEISYRTVEMLTHKQPMNHWLLKRAREKIAENTGFFSNVAKPYEFLGIPEMSSDMVIFRNLPAYLKITPDEWIEVQLRRERENMKQKARLPHLPHLKSRWTKSTRGRITQGAGGINHLERLIRNGERFQREIRGPMTFTKLLDRWFENIESENANRGSPFGQVKRTKVEKTAEAMPDLRGAGYERDDNGQLVTRVDDKWVDEEFLNLEKMITAIYNLVKSMINVKLKQLKSPNRIPFSAVMELRSGNAGRETQRKKHNPAELLGKFNKNTGFYGALSRGVTGISKLGHRDYVVSSESRSVHQSDSQEFEERLKSNRRKKFMLQFHGSGRKVPRPFNPVAVGEVYPLSQSGSAEDLKVAVERIKNIVESKCYLDDRPYELRSGKLRKERSTPQAERNRKHFDRFHAMFLRHFRTPEPLWWNVYVRDYKKPEGDTDTDEMDEEKVLNSPGSDKSDMSLPPLETTERPSSAVAKLYKAAGVKTMEKDLFQILTNVKRPFRGLEKSLRVNLTNKVEKFEWDTAKRYKAKIQADCSGPIYEKAIGNMRFLAKLAAKQELSAVENNTGGDVDIAEKQSAPWFRDLIEMCDRIGALKHHGCSTIVHKLVRFCDVNSNSKPFMLRRFCLLVISLPANELGSPHFQKAIAFLLEHLFGAPGELLPEWIQHRGL